MYQIEGTKFQPLQWFCSHHCISQSLTGDKWYFTKMWAGCGKPQRQCGTLGLQAPRSLEGEGTKIKHQKGSQTGACELQSRDAVSLSNCPRRKLGDLYLTHLPLPVSCWYIPVAKSSQKPEGKRTLCCSPSQSVTQRRGNPASGEKRGKYPGQTCGLLRFTHIWDKAGVFFS